MRTERETARTIRGWMQEPAELDDRGLEQVLARLPDTPQRRHRWLWPLDWRPFGGGATRSAGPPGMTLTERTRTMLNPMRMAAITAVLALTGTLALVSGPLAPSQPVPGAETPNVSVEPAHFSGTLTAWDAGAYETEVLDDRTVERWPVKWTSEMTDPRVSGSGEAMDYLETIRSSDGAAIATHTGVGRQSNDEGAYAVECQGVASLDADARIFCWYDGEEAYEGLTAFLILSGTGPSWDVEGWIYPGERPPLLEYES
jgi:hypothetical protein